MQKNLIKFLNSMYTTLVQICPGPLTAEGMHGALTAVALSPNPVIPNTWLPVLYNMRGEQPEFHSREQAKTFLDTSILAYNEVVASLTGDTGFEFTFDVDHTSGAEEAKKLQAWSEGFIKGLRGTGVDAANFDQDFLTLMSPIAFCARPDFFHSDSSGQEFSEQVQRIAQEMPANLTALRNYFYLYLQRAKLRGSEANEVGRNDPCPCGSGKKYKHCCGKETQQKNEADT